MNTETQFIENLIERTKAKKSKWEYLDADINLLDTISHNLNIYYNNAISDDSFILELSNSYIAIIHFNETRDYAEEYRLYIIPDTFRQVKTISSYEEQYAELLIRLDNIIKNQFPNPNDIMLNYIEYGDDTHIPF